jgi:hypothetical protein
MHQILDSITHSLVVFGGFFVVVGLLFILCPQQIERVNHWANRQLCTDRQAMKHSKVTGTCFLVVALIMFMIYAYAAVAS